MSNRPNMRNNVYFENTAEIYCTDTEKTVTAHVMSFTEGKFLSVAIAWISVTLSFAVFTLCT